ncbi:hypothetical protein [Rhizobium rhizogenes]|uniref:hypothetical protein n=1 Tax=Rhizobium rhizogenes TaxID=359 RepID=UPI001295897F|nr:hypothetical protein [Rhizobium rhizogenes]
MSTDTPKKKVKNPSKLKITIAKAKKLSVFDAFPELKKPDPNYIAASINYSHAKA